MDFLLEFKNRIYLIFIYWLSLFVEFYYYKKIIFFVLLKKLILINNLQIYFVYTTVTELFLIYLKLTNFFVFQITFVMSCYHFLTFIKPALYKNEFFMIQKCMFITILSCKINFLIIIYIIFPLTWFFFQKFEKLFILNLLYFEIHINDYIYFFLKIYFFLQFCFVFFLNTFLLITKNYYTKFYVKKFRKLIYFLLFVFIVLFNLSELFNQVFFFIILIYFFELSIIFYCFNLKIKKNILFFF